MYVCMYASISIYTHIPGMNPYVKKLLQNVGETWQMLRAFMLSPGVIQLTVTHHWVGLCTVYLSYSQANWFFMSHAVFLAKPHITHVHKPCYSPYLASSNICFFLRIKIIIHETNMKKRQWMTNLRENCFEKWNWH